MHKLEVARELYLSRLRESDRQLASARREESEMEASLQTSVREIALYIPKSKRNILLKTREDELITDMRQRLVKGHVEMRRQTAEVVESSF